MSTLDFFLDLETQFALDLSIQQRFWGAKLPGICAIAHSTWQDLREKTNWSYPSDFTVRHSTPNGLFSQGLPPYALSGF